MFKRHKPSVELLTAATRLPDNVEEDLAGMETFDFERKHNLRYGENAMLIPSVGTYDLPLLPEEDFRKLTKPMEPGKLQELIDRSAETVKNFDPQHAAEMAASLARAVERLS